MTEFNPNNYRILAVDDSLTTLMMVETTLKEAGFQLMTADSGEEALDVMKQQGLPHLAVVDVNMPLGIDGFELSEKIQQFCDLPIIMLTALDEADIIIEAIDKYAEDYMTKPFSKGELIARVRRVLRRIGGFAFELEQYTKVDEHFSVNFAESVALLDGEKITLTPTESKLLYIMMRSARQIISSGFIMRRLWPQDISNATEDRLRVYVHRLRTKIESDPSNPRYVLAQRGKGYSFGEPE